MKTWIDKETGIPYGKPDAVDEYLNMIWAIGVDYDGFNTVEKLKSLIDEMVSLASDARVALDENRLYGKFDIE